MLWRSAEGYIKHWFALLGAMLVVVLRVPLGSLLRDSWFYRKFEVLPYEFGLESALITTMTILIVIYISLRLFDYKQTQILSMKIRSR